MEHKSDSTPLSFIRSSFCGKDGGCVEVARDSHGAAIRDAKDPASPVLRFGEDEWRAFVQGVKAGEFS